MRCYIIAEAAVLDGVGAMTVMQSAEQFGCQTELVDAASPRGVQLATQYDLLARPVVVVTQDDGSYVQHWDALPSRDELAAVLARGV